MESFEINNQAKLIRDFVNQNIDYINTINQKKPINRPNRFNQTYFNKFIQNAIENYEDGNGCYEELKQKLSPLKLSILILEKKVADDTNLLDTISNIKQSFEDLEKTVKQRYEEPKLTRFVKKIDILHIEDNELERKTIKRYFKNNTVDIKSVETSEEAMYLLNNLTPKVILVDINLKTSSIQGDELCRLIKSNEEYRRVPVVLISALISKIQRHEILETTGANNIIIKPIEKLADLDIIFKYLKDPI
jgi:CheY-like chemotaxis protein